MQCLSVVAVCHLQPFCNMKLAYTACHSHRLCPSDKMAANYILERKLNRSASTRSMW